MIIDIGWEYFLGIMVSLILIAWYSNGRFTKVETLIETIEKRLTKFEGKSTDAFGNSSPLSLLDKGLKVLEESGLKEYIDKDSNNLFENCNVKHKFDTPYDVQESAFKFFDELKFDTAMESKLKNTAFDYGMSMDVIRRIGGIYFRDACLKRLKMKEEDIDKHVPAQQPSQ